jgi:hypothetical protein
MNLLFFALLAWQQTPLDEGTLVVREDTAVIGRETFRLAAIRIGAGGTGWTLATTTRYERPVMVLAPILEVSSDTQPSSFEFDVADPQDPQRIRAQLSRGRFTARFLGRRTERAREFPVSGRTVVLDDSVYALYLFAAWQARPQPMEIAAIVPRVGRREILVVRDLGVSPTIVNRVSLRLRHVTLSGGENELVEVWLDENDHLYKVEIPSRHLRVERLAPA